MSFYNDLQDIIVTRLNTWFTAKSLSFKAVAMPETEKQLQDIIDEYRDRPTVIVKYNESTYSGTNSINHVVQDETVHIALLIYTDKPSGTNGVYNIKQVCDSCLVGFKPSNCTKRLVLTKFQPVEWENLGPINTNFLSTERPVWQLDDEELILGEHFKELTINEN